jgi:hypothetical protein
MHVATLARWRHTHTFGTDVPVAGERRTRWVIGITSVMMVAEIAAGLAFGSMALLADGGTWRRTPPPSASRRSPTPTPAVTPPARALQLRHGEGRSARRLRQRRGAGGGGPAGLRRVRAAVAARRQQVADPSFDPKVAQPAYTKTHPKVLFDEAHLNFHTADGRYKPFASLITSDGYAVTPNKEPFTGARLKGYDILVIVNARGVAAKQSAFTDAECDAVRDWVKAGGSLLLIADHAPMGVAAENLGRRFGVEMSKGHTSDAANYDQESGNKGFIIYTRASGRLADHPTTRGRDASEQVNKITAFTGQSLKGPPGSVALMQLADTAVDRGPDTDADGKPKEISAAGRAQGLAFTFGAGRVIVLGEAAMLSAQLIKRPNQPDILFGMNRPGIDNRQFALNLMHWLSWLF